MGSAFLGIASGLSQGLAQGIQTGSQLAIAKNQLDLQKAQASAQTLNGLSNAAKIPDPAMRTLAFQRLLPGVGIDPNSDTGKQWITAMSKAGDESLKVAQQLFSDAGIQGMDARTVGTIMADHPELLVQLAMQAGQKRTLGTIMSGLPAVFGGTAGQPQTTQPAGTGDMGTGTAGAGGTVVAPVADAGTSAVSTQPAVSPAPAPAVTPAVTPPAAAPATTAPAQPAAPIQAGTPSTAAQPAATQPAPAPSPGYAGAAQPVSVGKDHEGNILDWNPNSDPNVQGINTIIDKLMVAPGNNEAAITLLKDKRNQYIEGQKYLKSNYVEMLHLQLQNKEIGIASYNAQINAAGLALRVKQFEYTKGKDIKEYEYRKGIDIKNYDYRAGQDQKLYDYKQKYDDRQFEYNKYRDELQQKVSEGNLSINQANLDLANKRHDFDVWKYNNTPLTAAGQAKWDFDHGFGPTGPQNTVDGGAPSDQPATSGMKPIDTPSTMTGVKNPAAHGESNGDGTFTMTDQALLPPGLTADQHLVWDSRNNKWYISTRTTTSFSTNEAVDKARTGVTTMNTGRDILQKLSGMMDKDSTSFGTIGYGKTFAQTIIGEAKDLGKIINKDPNFLKYIGLDKLPYDPNAPTLEGFHIVMRAILSRAITDVGTGLGAYTMNAKDLDKITDFQSGSVDDVRQRIKFMAGVVDNATKTYAKGLPTHSGADTTPTQLTPAKPDVGADPYAGQPEKPKTSWNKMNLEERRPYVDTIYDGNASKWAPLKGHTTHYAKIPNGDIINLKLSLQKYPAPEQQAEIHKQFNGLYGNGADAEVGYPP